MNRNFQRITLKTKIEAINFHVKNRLPLDTSEQVNDVFTSIFLNRGMEKDSSRLFEPNDDCGDLDVKLSLRHGALSLLKEIEGHSFIDDLARGSLFINRSLAERRSCLFLILDTSDSLLYGLSRDNKATSLFTTKLYLFYKLYYALYGYGLRNGFNVGIDICGKQEIITRPSPFFASRNINVEKINSTFIQKIERLKKGSKEKGEYLTVALNRISKILRYRSVVAVISDFNVPENEYREQVRAMSALSQAHHIIPCHITDPKEFNDEVLGEAIKQPVQVSVPVSPEAGEFLEFTNRESYLIEKLEDILSKRKNLARKSRLYPFALEAGNTIDTRFKEELTNYFLYYQYVSRFIKPV